MQIVLASASPWRRKLLHDAGLDVLGEAARIDETDFDGEGAAGMALARARAKAADVASRHPAAWVIGADQVVHQDGERFGKPTDPADHLARLQSMRGRTHELVTGWVLVGPGTPAEGVCVTRMHVRADLTDDELAAYVANGEGRGCAGGYAAEGLGGFLFSAIEGDWFNVIGLPLFEVQTALRARGWRFSNA